MRKRRHRILWNERINDRMNEERGRRSFGMKD
jgi:hypothetical protein